MPSPKKSENKKDYITRCMSSKEAGRDFPDSSQRYAFCNSKWESKGVSSNTRKNEILESVKESVKQEQDKDRESEDSEDA